MSRGLWQDYRGKGEGVLIHLDTSKQTELPVRDVLGESGKGQQVDPSYEDKTFGLKACTNSKTLTATVKNKRRYLLFGTRYQGTIEELKGRFLIIGYMRLDRKMEVRKRHVHQWMENRVEGMEPDCIDLEVCYAFQSEEMPFYAPEDAFELTEDLMKEWGYKGKITKQMKLTFSEDKMQMILDHFAGKKPINDRYIEEVKNLERKQEEFAQQQNQNSE